MQIRNNYDKDVFNGDVGYIESVNMDDPFRDASEEPCLYGYHQGKENLHHSRNNQGTGLFHPQHGRAEAEYEIEGKVITISLNDFSPYYPNPSVRKRLRWI